MAVKGIKKNSFILLLNKKLKWIKMNSRKEVLEEKKEQQQKSQWS